MKAYIGVDAVTGLTHSVVATAANIADVTMAGALVREDDKRVYGDAGYTCMWKHLDEEKDAPNSKCCVAAKRGAINKVDDSPMKTLLLSIEKASIRAKVEHPFHVITHHPHLYPLGGVSYWHGTCSTDDHGWVKKMTARDSLLMVIDN